MEREDEILQYIPQDKQKQYEDQCTAWNKFYAGSPAKQDDSGV